MKNIKYLKIHRIYYFDRQKNFIDIAGYNKQKNDLSKFESWNFYKYKWIKFYILKDNSWIFLYTDLFYNYRIELNQEIVIYVDYNLYYKSDYIYNIIDKDIIDYHNNIIKEKKEKKLLEKEILSNVLPYEK